LNNVDARRRFSIERPADGAKIGFASEGEAGGVQSYHGMLLSIQRRAVRGLVLNANYTASHCIGPYATLYDARFLWPYQTYTVPNNRRADRGNCDSDRRQVFNMSAVAETPQFSNRTMRLLASGWKFSGIYNFSAGSPLNILAGSDRALTGISDQRANQINGDPYKDKSAGPMSQYLNAAAFAQPDTGTIGNVGRNSVQGPSTWSFDVGVSRAFAFREMQKVEFRVEAFNILNSFRAGTPGASFTQLNSNTFGVVRTALEPRILQFALKYVF
jgi:hypothetical protein